MGDSGKLIAAMESGRVRWEGVMLNARHLGLSHAIKTRLGACGTTVKAICRHLAILEPAQLLAATRSRKAFKQTGELHVLSANIYSTLIILARLDASADQISTDHPRAKGVGNAAVRQLLLGGRRRRALSSLALYSSTGSYASISSIRHRE